MIFPDKVNYISGNILKNIKNWNLFHKILMELKMYVKTSLVLLSR